MAEGFKLGSAFLEIEPDMDGFNDKVKAKLDENKTKVKVPVEPDTRDFGSKLDAALLKTKGDSTSVKVKPNVDNSAFAAAGQGAGGQFGKGFGLKMAIGSIVTLALAALPAVAGPALILAGAGAGAAFLLATNKAVKAQGQTLVKTLTGVMTTATTPMIAPLEAAFKQIGGFVKGLTPVLTTMFSRFGALLQPVINMAESLLSHILPGINAFLGTIKGPMSFLSTVMGNLGSILGKFIANLGGSVMANSVKALNNMVKALGEMVPILNDLIGFAAAFIAHLTPTEVMAIVVAITALVLGFKGATLALNLLKLAGISFEESNPFGWIMLAITGIILLSAAVIKYHKQIWSFIVKIWGDVKNFVLKIWGEVLAFIEHSPLLAALGLPGLIAWVIIHFNTIRKTISGFWNDIQSDATKAWKAIANGIGTAFNAVKNAVSGPINWVLTNVIDKADGFLNHIPGVHLPTNLHLAGGGVLPGYLPGVDSISAKLSPGEAVLTPGAAMALGHDTINALNRAYAPGTGGTGMYAGVLHAAGGWNPISAVTQGVKAVGGAIAHGAQSVAHVATAGWDDLKNLAGDAFKAAASGLINGLIDLIPGSGAAKDIAVGTAKSVMNSILGFVSGKANAGSPTGPMGGPTGGNSANGTELFQYLMANVFGGDPIAAAGAVASIWGESGWNPFAQGTGGRGLIGWTPPGSISDSDFNGGMRTQLPAIIRFIASSGDWGVINRMKSSSSVFDAANLWGVGVERFGINDVHPQGVAAATAIMNNVSRSGAANRSNPGQAAVALHAHQGGRANGGPVRANSWYTVGENGPELLHTGAGGHVYSNQQSAGMAGNTVAFNYYGPQMPTPEMQAQMKIDLARALGPYNV